MVVITKLTELERIVKSKPCPSPACLACQKDISDLKLGQANQKQRMDTIAGAVDEVKQAQTAHAQEHENAQKEAADAAQQEVQAKAAREAWVIPMWVSVIFGVISTLVALFAILAGVA